MLDSINAFRLESFQRNGSWLREAIPGGSFNHVKLRRASRFSLNCGKLEVRPCEEFEEEILLRPCSS